MCVILHHPPRLRYILCDCTPSDLVTNASQQNLLFSKKCTRRFLFKVILALSQSKEVLVHDGQQQAYLIFILRFGDKCYPIKSFFQQEVYQKVYVLLGRSSHKVILSLSQSEELAIHCRQLKALISILRSSSRTIPQQRQRQRRQ